MLRNRIYYSIKPFIPRRLQIAVRSQIAIQKRISCKDVWPIDERAGTPPPGWTGWPDGKKFALVLTHDVETAKGQNKCRQLMKLEQDLGFRSSFGFVPNRYEVSPELRQALVSEGFEVGVHGLYHDGKYYESREVFLGRASRINKFLNEWGSVGYRAPSMLSKLEWFHDLDIKYDSSTFDTDPFEPQSTAVRTIFPFIVEAVPPQKNYIELPYTLPQDFTLFIMQKEKTIDIWKRKLDWIVKKGGMALLVTHPDYMNLDGAKLGLEEYHADLYKELLEYVRTKYKDLYWHVLPRDLARYWIDNSPSQLTVSKNTSMPPDEIKREKHVCMIAYTKYMNDARVRREAETLAALPGYHVSVLTLKEKELPNIYVNKNVKVQELNVEKYRGKSNINYLFSYFKFSIHSFLACSRLLLAERIDIVHVHNMPDFIVFSAIVPYLAGKKIILDIHDVMYETYMCKFKTKSCLFLSLILRIEERISCAFAHKIICTNNAQHEVLSNRGIPSNKITISMNVPEPCLFHDKIMSVKPTSARSKYKIVYHGTLAHRLGIDIAIRAIATLIGKIPAIEFYIIGDGDDRQEFIELSMELGVQEHIHFMETIPLEKLESVLENMDLGLVSNRKNCATELMLPVKMLEYIKLGIPVIVPRLKAIQEYFSEDMVYYFNPDNVYSLSKTILSTYNDVNMRREKSEKAKHFFDKFDWQIHKHDLVRLYENIS
jgi:glycosyltransferase involved in cell wall biosynthesis